TSASAPPVNTSSRSSVWRSEARTKASRGVGAMSTMVPSTSRRSACWPRSGAAGKPVMKRFREWPQTASAGKPRRLERAGGGRGSRRPDSEAYTARTVLSARGRRPGGLADRPGTCCATAPLFCRQRNRGGFMRTRRPAPRLDTPAESELKPAQRALAAAIASGPRGTFKFRGPFAIWLHAPEIGQLAQALGAHCRCKTVLPPRPSEFAILVTAGTWRAQYEWQAHAPMAEKAGVSAKTIRELKAGRYPKSAAADERAIYDFVSALYRTRRGGDRAYRRGLALPGGRPPRRGAGTPSRPPPSPPPPPRLPPHPAGADPP